jgi:hypothetical protein
MNSTNSAVRRTFLGRLGGLGIAVTGAAAISADALGQPNAAPQPAPGRGINVKSFGAVGNNIADNTSAIQAAITMRRPIRELTTTCDGSVTGSSTDRFPAKESPRKPPDPGSTPTFPQSSGGCRSERRQFWRTRRRSPMFPPPSGFVAVDAAPSDRPWTRQRRALRSSPTFRLTLPTTYAATTRRSATGSRPDKRQDRRASCTRSSRLSP